MEWELLNKHRYERDGFSAAEVVGTAAVVVMIVLMAII